MITSTTTRRAARMKERTWKFVPRTIPRGPGVTHGRLAENEFIPKVSTKNLKIQTFAIGAKINGMKKVGFNTIGAPKRIGSFTPKNVGTTDARPIARFRSDLHNHMKRNGTIKVAPVPTHGNDKHLSPRSDDFICVLAGLKQVQVVIDICICDRRNRWFYD